jgi:putative phosphoribosyl transferase
MGPEFADRDDAAQQLAARLRARAAAGGWPRPWVVLALPRGGVPLGAVVARALQAPLDLLLVRKIGLPGQPELAAAAVVDGDTPQVVFDDEVLALAGVGRETIRARVPEALRELERRRRCYLAGRQPLAVEGATVIVVDDGIATGTTVRAALQALRRRRPARLVLAVPVAPPETLRALRDEVDEIACLAQPQPFEAVGLHYRDFHAVEDDEVVAAWRSADAAVTPNPADTRSPR